MLTTQLFEISYLLPPFLDLAPSETQPCYAGPPEPRDIRTPTTRHVDPSDIRYIVTRGRQRKRIVFIDQSRSSSDCFRSVLIRISGHRLGFLLWWSGFGRRLSWSGLSWRFGWTRIRSSFVGSVRRSFHHCRTLAASSCTFIHPGESARMRYEYRFCYTISDVRQLDFLQHHVICCHTLSYRSKSRRSLFRLLGTLSMRET